MEPGERLAIAKLTTRAKVWTGIGSVVIGAVVTASVYIFTTKAMNDCLESMGERLYEDLGVVLVDKMS